MLRLAATNGTPRLRPDIGLRVDLVRAGVVWATDIALADVIDPAMPIGDLCVLVALLERGEAEGMRLSTMEGRHADRG